MKHVQANLCCRYTGIAYVVPCETSNTFGQTHPFRLLSIVRDYRMKPS